jgi:hypothetical protein
VILNSEQIMLLAGIAMAQLQQISAFMIQHVISSSRRHRLLAHREKAATRAAGQPQALLGRPPNEELLAISTALLTAHACSGHYAGHPCTCCYMLYVFFSLKPSCG